MKLYISPGNDKTGNIPSVSLPPGITCTREACRTCFRDGCYAFNLQRRRPNVGKSWANNLELWRTDPADYFRQIDTYLTKHLSPFFRFHIGGDIPGRDYLNRSYKLALRHPSTRFLAFSKRIELVPLFSVAPVNFRIVYSAWPGNDIPANGIPIAYMRDKKNPDPTIPQDARECPGNCETCGLCWSLRQGESVVFNKH